ncbi:hypothetical protein [Dyadobacter sp. 32]|uniref:hypothetical protein n=1 Tax=Dyadobacter sp. 32 TaxID=538966 RepID=UPI0011ED938F
MSENILKWTGIGSLVAFLIFLQSCHKAPDPLPITFFDSTFETGVDDWSGDAALYTTANENTVRFTLKQELLPDVLKSKFHGLKMEGTNAGDSLFLFVKKKITNLDPAKIYKVAYQIDLASSLPDTVGGAGRIVYLKAGASAEEPKKTLTNDRYLVSIKKGPLGKSGSEMLLLGNVANGLDSTYYRPLTRSNANLAVQVKPSPAGEIWLCVGVHTVFKGNIALYFDRIYAAVGVKTAP